MKKALTLLPGLSMNGPSLAGKGPSGMRDDGRLYHTIPRVLALSREAVYICASVPGSSMVVTCFDHVHTMSFIYSQ